MRTATAATLALVLVLVGATGAFALGAGGGGPTLERTWVSDTGRDVKANHHAPAAGVVDGRGMVYAPISGRADTTACALVALDAGTGGADWRYRVPAPNCTVHSIATPALADFDGDGETEVLGATTEGDVVALDAATGREELRGALTSYGYSKPVVADLVGGPAAEVAVVDVRGALSVFDRNGSLRWRQRLGDRAWGQPAAVDADADGATELLVATDGGRLTAFEGNGSVAWQRTDVGRVLWSSAGTVANETVFATATAGGQVGLFDAATGERRWQHDFGRYAAVNAIGDGDGDGTAEVYAVARDGELRAIDGASGDVEWTTTLTGADVQMTPPPTLGDVDGDGSEELVAVTNDGLVSLVDPTDGSVLSTHERNVPIYTYPSVVDTDDDGAAEVYVIYSDGRVVAFEGTE